MHQLGVSKAETLYVGDSDIDLLTAQNAGVDCVSVLWGFRDESFLRAHGATHCIHTPNELLTLLA
jgi:phosphoglycolate phosphatase